MNTILRLALSLALILVLLLANTSYALASEPMVKVIIGFNHPANTSDESSVKQRGGKVRQRFHLVPAMAAEVPASDIPKLRAMKGVSYVELDAEVRAVEQSISWGITDINADDTQSYNQGAGVKVAVIDTGINLSHPDLQVAGAVSYVSGNTTGNDDNGHGTHVAGIIAAQNNTIGVLGVAPQASLYAVKVLNSSGSGSWSGVISGIQWAVDNHMDIINMSLGSTSGSTALQTACNNAYNAGILVVVAAGNNGTTSTTADNVIYPARYDSVVAVASVDSSLNRSSFSSTGPTVEIAAPGSLIYSTYKNGTYTTLSGTSMASPHAAGVAALIYASGIADTSGIRGIADEVRARLQSTATDLGTAGRDRLYGYGLVNASAAVQPPVNHAPAANAGSDQTVFVGNLVSLDGSGSSDPDGDTLTYAWLQTAGDTLNLSDTTAVNPSFTPIAAGTYTFLLTVSDGELSASDSVDIVVRSANNPPTAPTVVISPASPGTNDNLVCSIVSPGTDPDGDNVTYSYAWYKNDILQSGLTTNTINFSYTVKGETWRCVVTPGDGLINGSAGSAEVTIVNTAPVANAGADQISAPGTLVTLNGITSSDADSDVLTYFWSQTGGTAVSLSNTGAANPTFTPTATGTYIFSLTVFDGTFYSSVDSVTITVRQPSASIMHVKSITMSLIRFNGGARTYAIAKVFVNDANGQALSDVIVNGHWSNATSSSVSGKTSASGQVVFTSGILNSPAKGTTFTFTVDNLTRSGWTYDYPSNNTSSSSISVR